MPHIKGTVRRSARKAGNEIPSPRYKHDLFVDPPAGHSKKKKEKRKKKKEKQVSSTKNVK